MSSHISDDLPRLLTGDASREVVMDAAAHLRTCPDCQQELVSAVVAHASLTSAHRFAPEIVSPVTDDDADEPPTVALPDLQAIFEQARSEAATRSAHPSRRRYLAVAVAAAVLIGAGTLAVVETTGSSSGPTTRSVALAAYNSSAKGATATMIGDDRMTINAASLPTLSAGRAYEVWLTDAKATAADQPQSIGFIGSDRKADLSVQPWLLSQYNTIAVSIQNAHQTAYSGNTVLFGTYRA